MTIKSKQNLGKKEIANKLSSIIGFSSQSIQKITDDIIEIISTNLNEDKKINLKNLGSLKVIFKKERVGRNPKTKETFKINSRNSVKFKASETLKKRIN